MCHSVRSLRSPVFLSFQFSDVAMRRLAIRPPFWKLLHFGVLAEVADQDDLVDAACHENSLRGLEAGATAGPIGDSREDVGPRRPASQPAKPRVLPEVELKPGGDRQPVGQPGENVGQREQVGQHEDRPFPPIGLAPGDRDRRQALRREHEPGEEGERGRQGPAGLRAWRSAPSAAASSSAASTA